MKIVATQEIEKVISELRAKGAIVSVFRSEDDANVITSAQVIRVSWTSGVTKYEAAKALASALGVHERACYCL